MTAIIMRSALEFWGRENVAPDVYQVVIDDRGRRVVTYAEHMAAKRARQAEILRRIRERGDGDWQAWRLSVWWSPGLCGWIYRGYHAWLDRYDGQHEWLRDGSPGLMRLFPFVLTLGSERDQWGEWMEAFVRAFPAGRKCGRRRGATIVWRRGCEFRRAR